MRSKGSSRRAVLDLAVVPGGRGRRPWLPEGRRGSTVPVCLSPAQTSRCAGIAGLVCARAAAGSGAERVVSSGVVDMRRVARVVPIGAGCVRPIGLDPMHTSDGPLDTIYGSLLPRQQATGLKDAGRDAAPDAAPSASRGRLRTIARDVPATTNARRTCQPVETAAWPCSRRPCFPIPQNGRPEPLLPEDALTEPSC